jgi:outer membrane protein TolC
MHQTRKTAVTPSRSKKCPLAATRGQLLFAGLFLAAAILPGCISDEIPQEGIVSSYQRDLAEQGPLNRRGDEGLDVLRQEEDSAYPALKIDTDPDTGKRMLNLSVKEALVRSLSNNPEIRVVSFDPSIAAEDITKAVAEFDPTAFGSYNYEKEDNPTDSIFLGGQSSSRVFETGLKQKNTLGTELSASYALTRNWDDLTSRTLNSRFEPVVVFQLKQPLLRDGWEEFNKAGINIATLNHRVSLVGFRRSTEDVAARVVTSYWSLLQARKDVEIQRYLLERTQETLGRVRDREGIDATSAQISQAETFLKSRESALLEVEKVLTDAQDALLQLLSDPQMSLADDIEVVPTTEPALEAEDLKQAELLAEAMANNPSIQQAKIGVEVADINVRVAKNQTLPRLDLVASSRLSGLNRGYGSANEQIGDGDYVSWALGVNVEYPLGNRARQAELRRRKHELSKARAIVHDTSDKVALETRERLRLLKRAGKDLEIQAQAVESAGAYLQGLEDMEQVRPSLTPEFLLVKLQAQESLAEAEKARARAVTEFNAATVQLARATGTVLRLHRVRTTLEDMIK